MNIGNIIGKESKIERILNRLEDPEYSYTREVGRVVSMDSKDIAHFGESQGRIEPIHRAVSLDNGQTQTLILFNRAATLPIQRGDELWVVGRREGAGRLRAMVVVVPALQMYADLTSESDFLRSMKLHIPVSIIIGLVGYGLWTQAGPWYLSSQYLLGLVLMALSMLLLTTGVCLKLVCGFTDVNGRRASPDEWFTIEKVFDRSEDNSE